MKFKMTPGQGVLISDVVRNGPAAKAGVKTGDVLLAFGALDVQALTPKEWPTDPVELSKLDQELFVAAQKAISSVKPGDAVSISLRRDGQPVSVQAVAVDRATLERGAAEPETPPVPPTPPTPGTLPTPAVPPAPTSAEQGVVGFLPIPAAGLTPQAREKFHVPADTKGVVAVRVVPGSPAAKAGLHDGDVLVKYAGKDMPSTEGLDPADPVAAAKFNEAFGAIRRAVKAGAEVELVVQREGKPVTLKAVPVTQAEMQKIEKAAFGEGPEDDDGEDGDDDEPAMAPRAPRPPK
jgi:serine protease Do